MIFRTLDANNDWVFGRGLNSYSSENAAIGLNVQTRILSWLNDCFFALEEGIDWYNRLGSKNQRELVEDDLRRIILQSEGVTGLIEFDTILNNRNLQVQYSISTIYTASFQNSVTIGI